VASRRRLSFDRQFVLQDDGISIVIVSARLQMRESVSVYEQNAALRASGVLATRVTIWKPW
jgi:hypothetical protein